MSIERIAAALMVLATDETAYRAMSNRNLAVIEGVLKSVAKWCHDELARRDKAA